MGKEVGKRKKARGMLSKSGYGQMGGHFAKGGHVRHSDEAEDKALIKKEVSKAKIKLKDGGCAEGGAVKPRADRLARGGKAHGKHKGTTVNVVVAGQHPQPKPVPVPVPVPAGAGGPPPPGAMAGPGPGAPPPPDMPPPGAGGPMGLKRGGRAKRDMGGAAPGPKASNSQRDPIGGMPAGHFKKGGNIKGYPIDDGAGGGLGRLEKVKAYGAR